MFCAFFYIKIMDATGPISHRTNLICFVNVNIIVMLFAMFHLYYLFDKLFGIRPYSKVPHTCPILQTRWNIRNHHNRKLPSTDFGKSVNQKAAKNRWWYKLE